MGALLLEQQDEWQIEGRRVFSELSMAKLDKASYQLQDQVKAAIAGDQVTGLSNYTGRWDLT